MGAEDGQAGTGPPVPGAGGRPWPHNSGHPRTEGRINVIGWIEYETTMKRLEITTYLEEKKWCVWFYCHWSNVGTNPRSEWHKGADWTDRIESNRSIECVPSTYRGKSYAYTVARNNRVKRGWHYSSQRIVRC